MFLSSFERSAPCLGAQENVREPRRRAVRGIGTAIHGRKPFADERQRYVGWPQVRPSVHIRRGYQPLILVNQRHVEPNRTPLHELAQFFLSNIGVWLSLAAKVRCFRCIYTS